MDPYRVASESLDAPVTLSAHVTSIDREGVHFNIDGRKGSWMVLSSSDEEKSLYRFGQKVTIMIR